MVYWSEKKKAKGSSPSQDGTRQDLPLEVELGGPDVVGMNVTGPKDVMTAS
jgi:hypothetical protein